jgi:hypothetical protein
MEITWESKRQDYQYLLFKILYQVPSTDYSKRRLAILEEFKKFVRIWKEGQFVSKRRFKLISVVTKGSYVEATSKSKWMLHITKEEIPLLKRWIAEETGEPYKED